MGANNKSIMENLMIDDLSIPVTDIAKARMFYDAVLSSLGAERLMSLDREDVRMSGYGRDGKPSFWIAERVGEAAAAMPGHIAFAAPSRAAVDAFHKEALTAGATDNGAPGLRPHYPTYYAGFVIDADGHRLEAVCHRPE
jgi:catechol 2,3-dioxygenase-like lactoylglutathione lyase family enzyme